MKTSILAVVALASLASLVQPAAAQQQDGGSGQQHAFQGTPQQQAEHDRIQAERMTCHAKSEAQGLQGQAAMQAMRSCMAQVDPAIVQRREACHRQAVSTGLQPGEAMRRAVELCLAAG